MSFSSFTSTLKLKTHSQLTQSPFMGTDLSSFTLSESLLVIFFYQVCDFDAISCNSQFCKMHTFAVKLNMKIMQSCISKH